MSSSPPASERVRTPSITVTDTSMTSETINHLAIPLPPSPPPPCPSRASKPTNSRIDLKFGAYTAGESRITFRAALTLIAAGMLPKKALVLAKWTRDDEDRDYIDNENMNVTEAEFVEDMMRYYAYSQPWKTGAGKFGIPVPKDDETYAQLIKDMARDCARAWDVGGEDIEFARKFVVNKVEQSEEGYAVDLQTSREQAELFNKVFYVLLWGFGLLSVRFLVCSALGVGMMS